MATKHGVRSLKLWFPNATRRVSRIQRSRSETNTFPPRGVSPECLPEVWWSWLGPMNELSNLERALELLQQLGLKEYESQAFVALSRPPAWDGQTDQRDLGRPPHSRLRRGPGARNERTRRGTTHEPTAVPRGLDRLVDRDPAERVRLARRIPPGGRSAGSNRSRTTTARKPPTRSGRCLGSRRSSRERRG
jgi:hypothetical protein